MLEGQVLLLLAWLVDRHIVTASLLLNEALLWRLILLALSLVCWQVVN